MSLQDLALLPYPLSAITPTGWLKDQLTIQAEGLSGHLDTFWPDIKDSAWIGGDAEGWERMPYWLDGVIPLAWLIGDEPLKTRITGYLDYILEHQQEDGWLGPRAEEKKEAADVWSQALALKMLVVYHDATGDQRIPTAVEKGLRMMDIHIDSHPLPRWGHSRWYEFLIAIFWLYERTEEEWLLGLASKLQAQGFSWKDFFRDWPMKERTPTGRWNYMSHVVNNTMAIKEGGLRWRLSGDETDRESVYRMMDLLDTYHGMPTGIVTGDECLAGTSATQGSELCSVVEYMYSLETLLSVFGDPVLADRLERITYNALPGTFSPDMWSHQYDQQLNQIECSIHKGRPWTTNGPDSNLFGLEPHFGCCTSNLSQGWPKFVASMWMQTSDGGIAAVAYGPSKLTTKMDDVEVTVELITEYPFRENLQLRVTVDQDVEFPLHFRIPGWTDSEDAGTFRVIKKVWEKGTTELELFFRMTPELLPRPHDAFSIVRGPLLYALPIGEEWKRVNEDLPHRELPHADWELYPTTPWNVALDTDPEAIRFTEYLVQSPCFSPETAPVQATVKGAKVPEWVAVDGSAGPTPQSPVEVDAPLEDVTLIPYGCTNLRIGEFPSLAEQPTP